MKQIVLFVLLSLSCMLPLAAQDTISCENPWYMTWPHGNLDGTGSDALPTGHSILQYYSNDSTDIVVYGVALTLNCLPIEEERQDESVDMTPTVMLFNHVAHGNPPTVSFIDSTNVLGVMKQCNVEYRTISGATFVSPSYEFYFHTPHRFSLPADTFYLSWYWPMIRFTRHFNWFYGTNMMMIHINYGASVSDDSRFILPGWHMDEPHNALDFSDSQYEPIVSKVGPVFPIIGLRCMPPTQIRFTGREGNAAKLSWWQVEAGDSYQLSVGAYGSNPNSGTMVSTTDTFYTFTGLEPDVIYQAWVRKACRYTTAGYDTVVWSDWSNPTTFRTAVGISAVEGDAAFSLSPNPAHSLVLLKLEQAAEGAALTLCDIGGRELRHERVTGTSYTLDILALPAGVYILKLTTPQGVATRRLLIAR